MLLDFVEYYAMTNPLWFLIGATAFAVVAIRAVHKFFGDL